ncbi:hypothetical protein Xen7305DRAFT_00000220 [Xenococcus sp. PCC 7305]|nr:hypothetical protein Xen7305DRAFT_00000220 [Xenococcus sp. PCC 7305]
MRLVKLKYCQVSLLVGQHLILIVDAVYIVQTYIFAGEADP